MENKFKIGIRVKCPLFGRGVVESITQSGMVVVLFDTKINRWGDGMVQYYPDGRYSEAFLPTLEPDEPEVIEWPEGANYLATDENGAQCFYGSLPFINEEAKEWNQSVSGFFDYKGIKCENWRESLIKRDQL